MNIFGAVLLCLALLTASAGRTDTEVHVVSVAEGWVAPGDLWAVPAVPVQIDRPGASAILILLDRGPVQWHVSLAEGTGLQQIALGGDQPNRSEVYLNDVALPAPDLLEVDAVLEDRGSPFRDLVALLTVRFGVDALSGFHSRYQASEDGFDIFQVHADLSLSSDPLAHLMDRETDLTWPARDPAGQPQLFGDVVQWNGERLMPTNNVPPVRFAQDVVHDAGRDVLYLMSLGGVGYLYQIDPASGAWTILADQDGYDGARMLYDAKGDRIIMTGAFGRPGEIRVQPIGQPAYQIKRPVFAFPGLTDLYDYGRDPPVPLTPIAADGDWLFVQATRQDSLANRQYAVNLRSGEVRLLGYYDG